MEDKTPEQLLMEASALADFGGEWKLTFRQLDEHMPIVSLPLAYARLLGGDKIALIARNFA
jgi:hypothetical protein